MRPVAAILFLLGALSASASAEEGLTFADLASRAISASFELRAEGRLLELRRTAWRFGLRSWLPSVTLGASEDERISTGSPDSFARSWQVSVSQLVWDGGRLLTSRRIESAAIDLDLMKLSREEREIGEQAVSSARAILAKRAELEVLRESGIFLREQKDLLAIESAAGLVAEPELRAAELSWEEAAIAAELSQAEVQEAERSLAVSLGLEELPAIAEHLDTGMEATEVSAGELEALALARNPDLLEARFSVKKAESALRLSRAAWLPTVSLEASGELGGDRYPLTEASWNAGLRVSFQTPFFTSSSAVSTGAESPATRKASSSTSLSILDDPAAPVAASEAKARLELETERRDLAVGSIGLKVREAIGRQELAARKLSLAKRSAGAERSRLELSRLSLSLGKKTRAELIEERIELGKREIAVIQAAAALLERERELEKLAGLFPGELVRIGGNHAEHP